MQVQLRKLSSIKPYKGNPRLNDKAVEAVARSIQEFGFRQPIVVDKAGVIVVGHVRYKAAQKLGLKQVPVHVARDPTPAQVRAYLLADNKTAEAATWGPQKRGRESFLEGEPIPTKDLWRFRRNDSRPLFSTAGGT